MSTTPAVPVVAPVATPALVVQSWLQKHERIVIVALVLLVGGWGLGKYLDIAASRSEARATAAEQALVDQKAQNAQYAAQVAQVEQQYVAMVQALAAQNAALAQAVAQRQASQTANQTHDAVLPLPDLANRLKTIGNAPEGSVSVLGDKIELSQPGAVAVTQTLETIPTLQGDLRDTQAALGATQTTLTQAGTVVADKDKQITGLNLQITDQEKSCTTRIASVTAESRKKQMSWFKRGLILGFLGGLFAGHSGL